MSTAIKAIVGLGNPGPRYFETRHNAGFWFVDALAGRSAAGGFRDDSRLQGQLASVLMNARKTWLFKPQCFMNQSGLAVAHLARYYRLEAEDLLVVHDEIDLPPGVARFKSGGGHGGHNGLRDLHRHIGNGYHRLRIGVGHPGHKDEVVDYVLRRPRAEEQQAIDKSIDIALDVIAGYACGDRANATKALHTQTNKTKEPGSDSGTPGVSDPR